MKILLICVCDFGYIQFKNRLEIIEMNKKNWSFVFKPTFFEVIIYISFSLLLMSTVLMNLTRSYIGVTGDPNEFMWYLGFPWHQLIHFKNPFVSSILNYPSGINLMSNTSMIFEGFLVGWIAYVFNVVFVFNLIFFLNQTLCMMFFSKTLKIMGVNRFIAIAGSLLSVMLPYLTAQEIGHPNLYVVVFLYAILYYIIKLLKNTILTRGEFFVMGGLFAAQFYTGLELFTTFVLFIIIGLILIYLFKKNEIRVIAINNAANAIRAFILFLIFIVPGIYYFFFGAYHYAGGNQGIGGWNTYVTDLFSIFIPTPVYLLHNNFTTNIANQFTGNFSEEDGYIGVLVMPIAIWSFYRMWKYSYTKIVSFLAIVFLILSFGSHIHILGNSTSIPGIWKFVEYIPLLRNALPGRLMLYVELIMLGIMIVAIDNLVKVGKNFWRKINVVMMLVIIFVFWFPNLPITTISKHAIGLRPRSNFNSLIHNQPVFILTPNFAEAMFALSNDGYRFPVSDSYGYVGEELTQSNALNNQLFSPQINLKGNEKRLYYSFELEQSLPSIVKSGVKYVVFFPGNGESISYDLYSQVTRLLGSPIYTHSGIVVWKVKLQLEKSDPIISNFSTLYKSAFRFIMDHNNIANLYPEILESKGYLSPFFGAYPRNSSAFNWTVNGGWIGRVGNGIGIGVIANYQEAKLIYEKYKAMREVEVFFPYPNIRSVQSWGSDLKSSQEQGQLLIVFKYPSLR